MEATLPGKELITNFNGTGLAGLSISFGQNCNTTWSFPFYDFFNQPQICLWCSSTFLSVFFNLHDGSEIHDRRADRTKKHIKVTL